MKIKGNIYTWHCNLRRELWSFKSNYIHEVKRLLVSLWLKKWNNTLDRIWFVNTPNYKDISKRIEKYILILNKEHLYQKYRSFCLVCKILVQCIENIVKRYCRCCKKILQMFLSEDNINRISESSILYN